MKVPIDDHACINLDAPTLPAYERVGWTGSTHRITGSRSAISRIRPGRTRALQAVRRYNRGDCPSVSDPGLVAKIECRIGVKMSDVTRIPTAIDNGDPKAAEQLLPMIYAELRSLAAQRLAQEKPGQTLQTTALVHDAYIRLVDVERVQHWDSRGHFFAAAAEAMRRILVDNARHKQSLKAGMGMKRVDLDQMELTLEQSDDFIANAVTLQLFLHSQPIKELRVRYVTTQRTQRNRRRSTYSAIDLLEGMLR